MSTISVFSSMRSRAWPAGCHARRSITPRSPQIENETSGRMTHSARRRNEATSSSAIAACRAFRWRPRSPPRQRGSSSMRTSRAVHIRRMVRSRNSPPNPRSRAEIESLLTSARRARSAWVMRRRTRSDRATEPSRTSSTVDTVARAGHRRLIAHASGSGWGSRGTSQWASRSENRCASSALNVARSG